MLYNQLKIKNPTVFDNVNKDSILNKFLANQALGEILIASAGIPRDFLSLFIHSYRNFISRKNNSYKHITLSDVRSATVSWYEADKQRAVETNGNAKIFLDKLIHEIIIDKKRCHFLIPEVYETHKSLNDLIDYRVLHLRKKGISHKGNPGVKYNVYFIDYACYTSASIYHNKINKNLLNEINTTDNLREIRRVSLSDTFFNAFNAETGNAVKCPHVECGKLIDIQHPLYTKQAICYHCFEKCTSE